MFDPTAARLIRFPTCASGSEHNSISGKWRWSRHIYRWKEEGHEYGATVDEYRNVGNDTLLLQNNK